MKTMTVSNFKINFSKVLKQINKSGETIAVTYGKKKEVVGYFTSKLPQQPKRHLGLLEGKAKFVFSHDFKMTNDEFLGL